MLVMSDAMSVNQVSWITKSEASIPRIDEANGRVLLRACLETTRGAVFGEKAGWRGATKENIPGGSSTEEQRSQTAFSAKTLRAAGLLSVAGVGSFLTARCGDARNSPPWPQPKSLAAAPLVVSKQALKRIVISEGRNATARFARKSKGSRIHPFLKSSCADL